MKRTLLGLMAVGLGVGLVGCSSSTGSRGLGSDNGNANGGPDADGDGIPDAMDPTPNGDGSGTPGGGAQPGGSGNPGGGQPDPGDNCEMHTVTNNNATPDMLIVLDKSGSMQMGNVNRWDPSVEGLKAITSATTTQVAFGLMSFPFESDQCGAGQLDEPIALNNAAAIASALDGMNPSGGTPTAATLQAAHAHFSAIEVGPDEIPHPQYVLLVTDGAPNCGSGGGSAPQPPSCSPISNDPVCQQMWQDFLSGVGGGFNQAEVDNTVAAIAAMAADGIKTYVIGYDTQSDQSLASAMDMMAVAGDTGDTQHRPVENKDELVRTFQEIAGSAISCEFVLDEPAPDPSYVLVEVDGTQINLDDPNGWILSADKKKITVQGDACKTLQDGSEHILNVEVQCNVVVPI